MWVKVHFAKDLMNRTKKNSIPYSLSLQTHLWLIGNWKIFNPRSMD